MHTINTRSLPLVLFILSMQNPLYAKENIEGSRLELEEVCLNGHAFAVIVGSFGSTMVQIYEAVDNKGAIPQPKRCVIKGKKEEKKKSSFFSW